MKSWIQRENRHNGEEWATIAKEADVPRELQGQEVSK
jgi:hypothetical protein